MLQSETHTFRHNNNSIRSSLTIAGNVLRKSSSLLEPAPAAAPGDISHLLKSPREGEIKKCDAVCLPTFSCESSKTVITSRQQYAAAERPAQARQPRPDNKSTGSGWGGAHSQDAELPRCNQTSNKDVATLHNLLKW